MSFAEPIIDIWRAAAEGQLERVQHFIRSGQEINVQRHGKVTPLHEAARCGQVEVAKWLLENGANSKAKTARSTGDEGACTPLHLAVRSGHTRIVSLLVEHGADVDARTSDGTTPLMLAAERGDLGLVKYLLGLGAAVGLQHLTGYTAFHFALGSMHFGIADLLLQYSPAVDVRIGSKEETALMSAAITKSPQVVAYLLERGAVVNAEDTVGQTALHYAVMGAAGSVTVWSSSDKGFEVKKDDPMAALEIIKLLLLAGADQDKRDSDGMTPWDWARKLRFKAVIDMLQSTAKTYREHQPANTHDQSSDLEQDEMTFLPIRDAARQNRSDVFMQNIRRDVTQALIRRGRLQGKKIKGKECVLVDDAFHTLMQFGVESFVYNQQGFSFTAIHAPIAEVARAFKARKDVLCYTENVRPVELSDDVSVTLRADQRDCFLVKTRASEWPVLAQTVHWIQSSDMLMSVFLAAGLSAQLKTQAVAAWDDDFSGSTLLLCDKGKKSKVISTEADEWSDFYLFFYEQGIHLPECFIHSDGKKAEFAVRDPAEIERVDHVVLAIPEESQVSGPHVGYKLGMMAEAMAESLEDEAAFSSHQVDGLWQRAQALLRAGKT